MRVRGSKTTWWRLRKRAALEGTSCCRCTSASRRTCCSASPQARGWWTEIRRYIEFYSWNLPDRYRPLANIGVVTAEPMESFEVMNLLARHNLPFEIIAPERLRLAAFKRDGGQRKAPRPSTSLMRAR